MEPIDPDEEHLRQALALGRAVRGSTSPNPWVGCRIVARDGAAYDGATSPPGGAHAEVAALARAGASARGATAYVTLEPCAHEGRTPPCTEALAGAGIARVVVGTLDPDPRVCGEGVRRLREAGVTVTVGALEEEVRDALAPYLKHRLTGRPYVVLKLATTLDGKIAAPDGSSAWITGEPARADVQRLRAESDAVLVGAGTVRADDPQLSLRDSARQPLRVVLGEVPRGARLEPALSLAGDLGAILDELGRRGVLQLLVEGGARVAHDFHAAGLVDRYVFYLAPALFGGADALSAFGGAGAPTITELWRGRLVGVHQLGDDVRLELMPAVRPSWLEPRGEHAPLAAS